MKLNLGEKAPRAKYEATMVHADMACFVGWTARIQLRKRLNYGLPLWLNKQRSSMFMQGTPRAMIAAQMANEENARRRRREE